MTAAPAYAKLCRLDKPVGQRCTQLFADARRDHWLQSHDGELAEGEIVYDFLERPRRVTWAGAYHLPLALLPAAE